MSKQNQFVMRGLIAEIYDAKTGTSANGDWKSIEFLLKEDKDDYPQSAVFRLFGSEKVDNFLQYNSEGKLVDVSFNLTTNEGKDGRHWNNLQAWKVFTVKADQAIMDAPDSPSEDEGDDLPF